MQLFSKHYGFLSKNRSSYFQIMIFTEDGIISSEEYYLSSCYSINKKQKEKRYAYTTGRNFIIKKEALQVQFTQFPYNFDSVIKNNFINNLIHQFHLIGGQPILSPGLIGSFFYELLVSYNRLRRSVLATISPRILFIHSAFTPILVAAAVTLLLRKEFMEEPLIL